MLNDKEKKSFYLFVIIILWLFHIINNAVIITNYPYAWATLGGEIREEIERLDTYNIISQIINSRTKLPEKFLRLLDLLKTPSQRPRTATFISAIAYLMFGEKYSIHIINALYYLLLILSTYLVGRKLFSNEIGLLSAYIVSLYPDIFIFSRSINNVDFLLTAIFIFVFYLLLCTGNFYNTVYSTIFGIFLGIGILIKGSLTIFIITPLLFYFYYVFKIFFLSHRKVYKPILNLIGSILIAAPISSLWWRGNLVVIFSKFSSYLRPNKIIALISNPCLVSTQPYGFFPRILYNITLFLKSITIVSSEFLFLIFIFGFFLLFRKKQQNFILIFYLIVPLVILLFSALKEPRYFRPILPLMAIMTSAGLFEITNKIRRRIIVTLACVIAFMQFFAESYGMPEYKFGEFYNKIYAEYNNVSEKFINAIRIQNKNIPSIAFISETSSKNHDLLMTLRYLMMKNGLQNSNLVDVENLDRCDFMVLLLDSRYFLKIASLLETGRNSSNINSYLFLFEKYLPWDYNKGFCEILLNPKKFNACIINTKQLFLKKSDRSNPLEIYDKLLVLEAIKRKMLNIEQVKKQNKGIFNDVSLWSKIYNERGISGLIQDLTFSHEEFESLLEGKSTNKCLLRTTRWRWLYRNIVDYQLVMIEHGEIPSLGLDFYLFKKAQD